MEQRLAKLLKSVVDEYVATAEPVGSQYLVEHYHMDVSPATVRNWFTELEDEDLVAQPHTSGGRVPTEKGFRVYIQMFVQPKPASKREREVLERAINVPRDEGGHHVKNLAKTLADLSGQATVVGFNSADTYYTGLSQLFAQPEFKNWQRVISLSEVLDRLDETLHRLRHQVFPEPQILLGSDCPFGSSCGTILGSWEGGLIGILGPIRMDYQMGLSLLSTAIHIQ